MPSMVWHNFHLNDVDVVVITDFFYEGFQSYINAIDQDLTAVFWTPSHMIFARVHHMLFPFVLLPILRIGPVNCNSSLGCKKEGNS